VLSVIQRFNGRGENADDLFQVGCVGLIKAIDNFDMSLNVQFSTYAVPMIIGEIRRHLRDNNPIRVSRSMRDLAYKALQTKEKLLKETQKEPTIEDIAKELNINKEDIVVSLDSIQSPVSLQEPVFNESNESIYIMDQVKDQKNTDELWAENITILEAMKKLNEKDRYQTVYAKNPGSAAAPTAGLHFTPEMLDEIKQKGVKIAYVTLHVGLGTFRPVKTDDVLNHTMHSEYYEISEEAAQILNQAKANHQRIISVGTTSTRVLESVYNKYNCFKATKENTNIFIYPGYELKAVDALITNFHLPKSTLIMLVSSLAGKDLIFKAYHHAVEEKYRFFSFGDSMFITNE